MPDWKKQIRKQVAELRLAAGREAEIVDELAQHAEDRYRELKSGGHADGDAERMALEDVCGRGMLASGLRAVDRTDAPDPVVLGSRSKGRLLADLGQDLRYAFRTLRKARGFTAIAILTLALGIGANTAIFSVVNGVLLRPLSYPDAGRLLMIYESTAEFAQGSVSYENYLDWRRQSRVFEDMGVSGSGDLNFTGSGEPEQLAGRYVSPSLLKVAGAKLALGRGFLPQEDREGAPCTAILSYGLWKGRFAADPNVLGKSLTLNAKNCAVVGVLASDFRLQGDTRARIYLPIEQWNLAELHSR